VSSLVRLEQQVMRISLAPVLLAVSALLAALAWTAGSALAQDRPNILVIMGDDVGMLVCIAYKLPEGWYDQQA